MPYLQNLHTHTIYCDGNDTPEEMVKAAIAKGFSSIGFSGHSHCQHYKRSMSRENTQLYRAEIARLKEAYRGQIEIFCGLEMEMRSDNELSGYDYVIGSMHYIFKDGNPISVDNSADTVANAVQQHFGGDGLAYACAYYEALAQLPSYGNFDILGHFDLVSKFSEREPLFDVNAPAYLAAAQKAAEAISGKIPYFEVNSGAMARGYRTAPYPSLPLMGALRELGFCPVISSDCHAKENLDCGFDTSRELLKKAGFTAHYILTQEGFVPIPL